MAQDIKLTMEIVNKRKKLLLDEIERAKLKNEELNEDEALSKLIDEALGQETAAPAQDGRAMRGAEIVSEMRAGVELFYSEFEKNGEPYGDRVIREDREANRSDEEIRERNSKRIAAQILQLDQLCGGANDWLAEKNGETATIKEVAQSLDMDLSHGMMDIDDQKALMNNLHQQIGNAYGVRAVEAMDADDKREAAMAFEAGNANGSKEGDKEGVKREAMCHAAALYIENAAARKAPMALGFDSAAQCEMKAAYLRQENGSVISSYTLARTMSLIGGTVAGVTTACLAFKTAWVSQFGGMALSLISAEMLFPLAMLAGFGLSCGLFVGGIVYLVMDESSAVQSIADNHVSKREMAEREKVMTQAKGVLAQAKQTFKTRVVNPCKAAANAVKRLFGGKKKDEAKDEAKDCQRQFVPA